jgi:hypothetical protein
MVQIKLLTNQELTEFLVDNPRHQIFHTLKWKKFIQDSFKVNIEYAAAIDHNNQKNTIVTVLPFAQIKSKIFKNRIISTPYLEFGGITGNPSNLKCILNYLKAKFPNNEYIEVRSNKLPIPNQINSSNGSGIITKTEYTTTILNLPNSKDDLWKNIHKHKRNEVRKAQKKEIITRQLNQDDLNKLYKLYLITMQKHGTPPYSKKYFKNFFSQSKLVAVVLGFVYNNQIHITLNASLSKFNDKKINTAVYWGLIESCYKQKTINQIGKITSIDFGRSHKNNTNLTFKKKWNANSIDLTYIYFPIKAKTIPNALDQTNKKYQLAIKIWRLLPLKFTQLIGMPLRKSLGI